MRGSYYRALPGTNLEFWISGRLWEVVAYERRSHMEVRLYSPCRKRKKRFSCCTHTTKDTSVSSHSFKTQDIFYLINALVELAFVIANVFLQLMAL